MLSTLKKKKSSLQTVPTQLQLTAHKGSHTIIIRWPQHMEITIKDKNNTIIAIHAEKAFDKTTFQTKDTFKRL